MRAVLYLLCGVAGGLAGALLVGLLEDSSPRLATRDIGRADLATQVEVLRQRIEALERRSREPVATPPVAGTPADAAVPAGAAPAAAGGTAPEVDAPLPAEVLDVARALVGRAMGSREVDALWRWLGEHQAQIPALVEALLGQIASNPTDPELRVALATAYVGELMYATPPGAQQGAVWMRAAQAYDKAIELDPNHWQARFGKAIGTTFIPPQFGQQPYAVRQFEELAEIQERGAPQPQHVQTYFQLGTLYREMGNVEKARAVWQRGLALFPDNAALKEALEVSTTR